MYIGRNQGTFEVGGLPANLMLSEFLYKDGFYAEGSLRDGGHVTGLPDCLTYSSIVSHEMVRIVFLLFRYW